MRYYKSFYMKDRSKCIMNKLELTSKQLEFLKFVIQDFEYNDNEEKNMIDQIEAMIYELQEQDALRIIGALKAQAKRPTAEW